MAKNIDRLIINSPHEEPRQHWFYDRENRDFYIKEGRRPAGYIMATPDSKGFDDPGIFVKIEWVNKIRPRVKAWRESGYPGVTGITKRLLDHWHDPEERKEKRFFFCQLEAIETLIWLTEAPASEKEFKNLNDTSKESVIAELHKRWSDPNIEIVKRMNRFVEKSPEILKPILEG